MYDTQENLELELINMSKYVSDIGLVPGSSGNVSFKLDNKIHITATGTDLGKLCKNDIAITDMEGGILKNKPSIEIAAHRALYSQYKEINAVVHVHGVYISAYTSIANINSDNYPVMVAAAAMRVAERIPVLEYFHPHPVKNYKQYIEGAKKAKIFFHQNHGVFIGMDSITKAAIAAEVLESNFRIYFTANSIGQEVNTLNNKQIHELHTKSYLTNE